MHQKHPPLARPLRDRYARTDLAFVGTVCATIDPLLERWATTELAATHRTTWITGDHAGSVSGARTQVQKKVYGSPVGDTNEYDDRIRAGHYDLALVNGNHYPAPRQIVFVDPAKAGTLERRRDQLTDVLAIVFTTDDRTLPDWLAQHLAATGQTPPQVAVAELDALVLPLLRSLLITRAPALNALVLTGGKSTRMGTPKAELVYRPDGRSERERLLAACREIVGDRVYESVATARPEQAANVLADRFVGTGPLGAIATALQHDPDAAWLVVACDLPFLEAANLRRLVDHRRPSAYATAYRLPEERFPEPLVAIYEPKAYPRLLSFLGLGYACPRKVLINSEVEIVVAESAQAFANVNTPEERAEVLKLLSRGTGFSR